MANSKVTSRPYGLNTFRTVGLTNSAQTIKDSRGNVFGYNLINPSGAKVYVKFYNADATVGTTTPVWTVLVPSGENVAVFPGELPVSEFDTRIEIAAVTGLADSDATAPASTVVAEVTYA